LCSDRNDDTEAEFDAPNFLASIYRRFLEHALYCSREADQVAEFRQRANDPSFEKRVSEGVQNVVPMLESQFPD
jgi:hypothetical protein